MSKAFDIDGRLLSSPHHAGLQLDHAWFAGVALLSDDFESAFLKGADFSGASCYDVCFRSAHLESLRGAGLQCNDCDFTESHLRDAVLTGARFQSSRFVAADLDSTFLTGASLVDCNARNACFNHSVCKNTNFRGTNLEGASFRSTTFLGYTNLEGALNFPWKEADLLMMQLHQLGLAHLHFEWDFNGPPSWVIAPRFNRKRYHPSPLPHITTFVDGRTEAQPQGTLFEALITDLLDGADIERMCHALLPYATGTSPADRYIRGETQDLGL